MAELSVKQFRNSNDGDSLYVPVGVAFDSIPEGYRDLIDATYRTFLDDPVGVLTSLAGNTSFEMLSSWLNELAESERFGLIVHYANFFGNIQHELTICCTRDNRQRFVRLPNAESPVNRLPHPLNELYRVTNGIIESADAFMTSKFVSFPDLFFDFESSYPIENATVSNLAELLAFYRTDTGDYLVADGDDAFAFCHDDCSFHKCGTVLNLLYSYFKSDLENSNWSPFPYR